MFFSGYIVSDASSSPLNPQGFPITIHTPRLELPIVLSVERARHIAQQHPDLWFVRPERIQEVLTDPDWIQTDARDTRGNKRMFIRKYTFLYTVVVVVLETEYAWIIHTSHISRRLRGDILWQREA